MLTFRERLGLVRDLQEGCLYAVAYGGEVEWLTWANANQHRFVSGESGVLLASVPLEFRRWT